MMIRNLVLPDGRVMSLMTGEITTDPARETDITWDELSGKAGNTGRIGEPRVGCLTGGDLIAYRLLDHLARDYDRAR